LGGLGLPPEGGTPTLLWHGLLTVPLPATEGLLFSPRKVPKRRPSVQPRGTVGRPCHNKGPDKKNAGEIVPRRLPRSRSVFSSPLPRCGHNRGPVTPHRLLLGRGPVPRRSSRVRVAGSCLACPTPTTRPTRCRRDGRG